MDVLVKETFLSRGTLLHQDLIIILRIGTSEALLWETWGRAIRETWCHCESVVCVTMRGLNPTLGGVSVIAEWLEREASLLFQLDVLQIIL